MTLCQICFWLAPHWTRSRMLCYHGPIFQRPRGRRAQREFTRAACQWVSERLSLCVCGWPRVWVMSVVVTISVSVRANVSLSSEIRDVIGFWASLRKKTSKGAASANKTQIWRTTENLSGLPMLPTSATKRDEQVTYTAQHRCLFCAWLLLCFAHYYGLCVLYARSSKSWHPNSIAV